MFAGTLRKGWKGGRVEAARGKLYAAAVRSFGAVILYFGWILIGGGLAAPWIWRGAQTLAELTAWEGMQSLAGHPFHRYVHRCLLVMALIALPRLARTLGARRWVDVGFRSGTMPGSIWKEWRVGALLGMAMFLPALGCEWLAGARVFQWPATGVAAVFKASEILGGAVLVGILEETLFRGVLFGGLRRSIGAVWAGLVSSLVYALVHFFERPAPPPVVVWYSGLEAVGQMLGGFVQGDRLVPFFATLTLAGILLAWWYDRMGSLWLPMGMHTGWVVSMKVRGWLTTGAPSATGSTRWALSWDWLCLAGIAVALWVSMTWYSSSRRERPLLRSEESPG